MKRNRVCNLACLRSGGPSLQSNLLSKQNIFISARSNPIIFFTIQENEYPIHLEGNYSFASFWQNLINEVQNQNPADSSSEVNQPIKRRRLHSHTSIRQPLTDINSHQPATQSNTKAEEPTIQNHRSFSLTSQVNHQPATPTIESQRQTFDQLIGSSAISRISRRRAREETDNEVDCNSNNNKKRKIVNEDESQKESIQISESHAQNNHNNSNSSAVEEPLTPDAISFASYNNNNNIAADSVMTAGSVAHDKHNDDEVDGPLYSSGDNDDGVAIDNGVIVIDDELFIVFDDDVLLGDQEQRIDDVVSVAHRGDVENDTDGMSNVQNDKEAQDYIENIALNAHHLSTPSTTSSSLFTNDLTDNNRGDNNRGDNNNGANVRITQMTVFLIALPENNNDQFSLVGAHDEEEEEEDGGVNVAVDGGLISMSSR